MSFFRDKSRLSDRLKGKTTDEIINELRNDFDKDRGTSSFFDSDRPSTNRTRSRFGPSVDHFFSRSGFDDDLPRRGSPHRTSDLRSHLDDLARRHPDIADQLRGFPSGDEAHTSSDDRTGTDDCAAAQDSTAHSQDEGCREDCKIGNLQNHGLRNTVPLVDPPRSSTGHHQSAMNSSRAQSAPPQSGDELSQQQPPPQQRFVSRIEIQPNGNQSAGSDLGQQEMGENHAAESAQQNENQAPPQHHGQPHSNYNNQQQQHQQHAQETTKAHVKQPNVRHIPIFVEGRDTPIVNRDHEPPSSFHHQEAPPYHEPPPAPHHPRYREPIFEPVFSAANSVPVDRPFGGVHHTSGGVGFDIPIQTERGSGHRGPQQFGGSGFSKPQQQQPPQQQRSAPSEKVHRVFTQHADPAQHHPRAQTHAPHQSAAPPTHDVTDSSGPPAAPSPPPKKMSRPKTPLEIIQEVQAEVDKLKTEIDKYSGTSRSEKEYIYLDEMLTRELLKLDNVESGGVEEIRQLRRTTIKNIQATIAALEAKVPSTPCAGAVNEVVPSAGGGAVNEVVPSTGAGGDSEHVAGSGVGETQGQAAEGGDANATPMEVDASKPEGESDAQSKGKGGEGVASGETASQPSGEQK